MAVNGVLLKVITGLGTVAVGSASTVLVVVNDPKPASAPLQPHVTTAISPTPSLAPLPASCPPLVTLTSQQQTELKQLQQASRAQRRALLATFPSADRMQILAYQAQKKNSSGGACGTGSTTAPSISANTTTGGTVISPVITYVS